MNRISTLISSSALDDRKNQSETINIGDIFKKLLDEDNDDLKHFLQQPVMYKEDFKNEKVFEYHPPSGSPNNTSSRPPQNTPQKSIELPKSLKLNSNSSFSSSIKSQKPSSVVSIHDSLNSKNLQPSSPLALQSSPIDHQHKSSSSNIGIKKFDDLNMDHLLADQESDLLEDNNERMDMFTDEMAKASLHDIFQQLITANKIELNQEEIQDNIEVVEDQDYLNELQDLNEVQEVENKEEIEQDDEIIQEKDFKQEDETEEEKKQIKDLKPLETEDIGIMINKNEDKAIPEVFSPQNMAAKLLSSLNNKQDKIVAGNDMLIYDDTILAKSPDVDQQEDIELTNNDLKDTQIETGTEDLVQQNILEYKNREIQSENPGDLIAEELINQLILEIQENLFPQRYQNQQDFWHIKDPSFNSYNIRKLAFEGNKGIQTDFSIIDTYFKEVIEEIIKNESTFINNILTPIQRDPCEMLHLLRTSDIGSYSHFDTYDPIYPILGVEIYLEIEKSKEIDRQDSGDISDQSQSLRESLVGESEHIHNKNIFDCINESLNQFRPYGKEGVPMPWSTKLRKLREDEILEFSKMFEIIKQDLFRWSYAAAGTLPKREFMSEEDAFDEDYFGEVREKRLASLLASDVIENEYKWVNYDFEESQVKIDIADMIFEQILIETSKLLSHLPSSEQSLYLSESTLASIFTPIPLPYPSST
jgi:hypothetical protein